MLGAVEAADPWMARKLASPEAPEAPEAPEVPEIPEGVEEDGPHEDILAADA